MQSITYGSTVVDKVKSVYEKGNIVKIKKCNKHKWCSVQDTPFYVKGCFFKFLGDGRYEKRSDNPTGLYVKTSYLEINKNNLFTEDHTHEKKNIAINKSIGYTRINFRELKKELQEKVVEKTATVATVVPVVENKPVQIETPVVETNLAVGLQAGVNYKIQDDIGLFTQYQIFSNQHTTNIGVDSIDVNFLHNLQIGAKYEC